MKKSEFITQVANRTGLSKKETEHTVDMVFAVISDALAAGDKLQFSGFGTFETRSRAARTGHNPSTGEAIEIAASVLPAFRPGKTLKDRVNGK